MKNLDNLVNTWNAGNNNNNTVTQQLETILELHHHQRMDSFMEYHQEVQEENLKLTQQNHDILWKAEIVELTLINLMTDGQLAVLLTDQVLEVRELAAWEYDRRNKTTTDEEGNKQWSTTTKQ